MSQPESSECESSVKGWEIVPYIPKKTFPKSSKRPYWPHFATTASIEPEKKQEAELHEYICEYMSDIVRTYKWAGETTTIKLKRAVPINAAAPRKKKKSGETVKRERAKRNTAKVIVSVSNASIDLPSDFPDVDIDKLPVPEWKENINGGNYKRKFTFSERLKGWSGKRTQRPGESRSDPTYKHIQSGVLIRSYISMVKFLIYEEIQGFRLKSQVKGKRRGRKPKSEGNASSSKRTKKNENNNNTAEESEQQLAGVEAEGVRCSEGLEGNPEKANSEENVSSSKKRKRTPNDKNNNASEEHEQIMFTEAGKKDKRSTKSTERKPRKTNSKEKAIPSKRSKKSQDTKNVSNEPLIEALSNRVIITAEESKQLLAKAKSCVNPISSGDSVPKGNKEAPVEESKSFSEQTISEQICPIRRANIIAADDEDYADDATSDPARAQKSVNVNDVAVNVADKVMDGIIVASNEAQATANEVEAQVTANEVEAKLNNGYDDQTMVIIDDNEYQMDLIFDSLPELLPINF